MIGIASREQKIVQFVGKDPLEPLDDPSADMSD